jgi:hypothetical protein
MNETVIEESIKEITPLHAFSLYSILPKVAKS